MLFFFLHNTLKLKGGRQQLQRPPLGILTESAPKNKEGLLCIQLATKIWPHQEESYSGLAATGRNDWHRRSAKMLKEPLHHTTLNSSSKGISTSWLEKVNSQQEYSLSLSVAMRTGL